MGHRRGIGRTQTYLPGHIIGTAPVSADSPGRIGFDSAEFVSEMQVT
jgi:hypothetical protein